MTETFSTDSIDTVTVPTRWWHALADGRGARRHRPWCAPRSGNVDDPGSASTYCSCCGEKVIGWRGYTITGWALREDGACRTCGTVLAGVFEGAPGAWGSRRVPVRLSNHAAA